MLFQLKKGGKVYLESTFGAGIPEFECKMSLFRRFDFQIGCMGAGGKQSQIEPKKY